MNTQIAGARVVRTWRWVAAALAVSQLVAPAVVNSLAGDFLKSGATNEVLITPAGTNKNPCSDGCDHRSLKATEQLRGAAS